MRRNSGAATNAVGTKAFIDTHYLPTSLAIFDSSLLPVHLEGLPDVLRRPRT